MKRTRECRRVVGIGGGEVGGAGRIVGRAKEVYYKRLMYLPKFI